MEVVEEGESSPRPAKRKEEGRRGPGRPSAPPTAIAIGSRMDGILFASTVNKPRARRPAHCWGLTLAADCPVGLVLLIGIAHHGIKQPSCCWRCAVLCYAVMRAASRTGYRTACKLQRNALLVWSLVQQCHAAHSSRGCQDRLDRQALRASAFPTMDSLHTRPRPPAAQPILISWKERMHQTALQHVPPHNVSGPLLES